MADAGKHKGDCDSVELSPGKQCVAVFVSVDDDRSSHVLRRGRRLDATGWN
jgi:hypothetical protein